MIASFLAALMRPDPVASARRDLDKARRALSDASTDRAKLAADLAAAERSFEDGGTEGAAALVATLRLRAERASRIEQGAQVLVAAQADALKLAELEQRAGAAVEADKVAAQVDDDAARALVSAVGAALAALVEVRAAIAVSTASATSRAAKRAQALAAVEQLRAAAPGRALDLAEQLRTRTIDSASRHFTRARVAPLAELAATFEAIGAEARARVVALVAEARDAARTIGAPGLPVATGPVLLELARTPLDVAPEGDVRRWLASVAGIGRINWPTLPEGMDSAERVAARAAALDFALGLDEREADAAMARYLAETGPSRERRLAAAEMAARKLGEAHDDAQARQRWGGDGSPPVNTGPQYPGSYPA